MRHFRHHIGDYAAATAHLSMLEDAAYHRLLRHYYQHEKPIPSIESEIYRICRAYHRTEKKAVNTVLREFFTLEQDGWHQRRADQEINVYKEQANRGRTNGTKGGRPRQVTDEDTPVERQPITNNQEPITNSEANASGASAPDPREIIFRELLPWLTKRAGKDCRSLVGKWLSETGDDWSIQQLLWSAKQENPVDPISWIAARLKPRPPPESWNERRIRLAKEAIAQ